MKKFQGILGSALLAVSLVTVPQFANAGKHKNHCSPGGNSSPDCAYEVEFKGNGTHSWSTDYSSYNDATNDYQTVNVRGYSYDTSKGELYETGTVAWSGGLGVDNGYGSNSSGDGSHTIDNQGHIDAVLLSFESDVSILDITLSLYGDSDITIYESDTFDPLNLNSWSLVGNYYGPNYGGQYTHDFGDEGVGSSSYYLLTAMSGNNSKYDLFKLLSLTYCEHPDDKVPPSEVSAPATLGLLLAGLPLLMRRFRRK